MNTPVDDARLFELFPDVGLDHDNKALYLGFLQRELRLNRCGACGFWHHPPLPQCPKCWSTDVVATPVSGRGTVYLITVMHQGPATPGVEYSTPYAVGSVELEEQPGLRFTSAVAAADGGTPTIGETVELGWIDRQGVPFPVFAVSP
jgi:uncharacterized OB-fold protein